MRFRELGAVCLVLSAVAMLAGAAGMVLSFLYLASTSPDDIRAGAAGFVAGSILIGASLISIALLATSGSKSPEGADHKTERITTDIG